MLSFKDDEKSEKIAAAQKRYDEIETNNKAFTGTYPPTKESDVGFPFPQKDFFWSSSEEPHTVRRRLILQKYPEINNLMGHCPRTKYWVLLSVVSQFLLAYYLEDKMWGVQYWVSIIDQVDFLHYRRYNQSLSFFGHS